MDSIVRTPSERWTVDHPNSLACTATASSSISKRLPLRAIYLLLFNLEDTLALSSLTVDFVQTFWILHHLRRPNVNDHVAIRASCHTHARLPISVQRKLAVVMSSSRRYMQRSDSMRFDLVLPKFFRLQALDTPSPKSKKSHPSSNHPKSAVGDDSQANGPSAEKCSRAWPNSSHRSCVVYLPQPDGTKKLPSRLRRWLLTPDVELVAVEAKHLALISAASVSGRLGVLGS